MRDTGRMTLPLPSIPDLLYPPYMALLRRCEPVLVPPGEQWTTVSWERADSDAWAGFDASRPDGWRAPAAGIYHAVATDLRVASPESFVLECVAVVDGAAAESTAVVHLLTGSPRDEFDDPACAPPVMRHVRQFAALVDLALGQRVGLALRHSLPVPLLVESEGGASNRPVAALPRGVGYGGA